MMTRTTQRTVTFRHPFALGVIDGLVAAGDYLTETDEEMVDVASRLAWRRIATTIHIKTNGTTQVISISPAELDELLVRDQRASAAT
jgi:hypothetical protein